LPKLSLAGITKTELAASTISSQEHLPTLPSAPTSQHDDNQDSSNTHPHHHHHVKLPSPSPVSLPPPSFPTTATSTKPLGGFKIPSLKILDPKGSNPNDQSLAENSSNTVPTATPIVVLPAKPTLSFKIPSLKIVEPKGGNDVDAPTTVPFDNSNHHQETETELSSSTALKPILKPSLPKLSLKGISKTDLSGKVNN
jgi:hypothetical protein